jgi:ATP-dependent RNA helicase SUPV3L1/SUV3
MGLNLPIDRLYFATTRKWDGTQERALTASEIRQIAGRAGRYQQTRTGVVGAVFDADLDRITRAIETPPPVVPVRRLHLGLTLPLATELAHLRNTESLANVLAFFARMKDSSGLFQPQVQPQVIHLATLLDAYPSLAFAQKYRLALAPVNVDDPVLFAEYTYHVAQLAEHQRLRFAPDTDDPPGMQSLLEVERLVKLYTLRLWFAFQYADAAAVARLEQRRDAANTAIETLLRAKAQHQRKRCRVCGGLLPRFSSYGLCQRCFTRGRRT